MPWLIVIGDGGGRLKYLIAFLITPSNPERHFSLRKGRKTCGFTGIECPNSDAKGIGGPNSELASIPGRYSSLLRAFFEKAATATTGKKAA